MLPSSRICLTSDLGSDSIFLAQIKGVLWSHLPSAQLVDLKHDLPPWDLHLATNVMHKIAFSMPLGTTHCLFLDPGYGACPQGIAIQVCGMFFVGFDNGVLTPLAHKPSAKCVFLHNPAIRQPLQAEMQAQMQAQNFAARDVLAPAAAALAGGLALSDLGPYADPKALMPTPAPRWHRHGDHIYGKILSADRLGALATDVAGHLVDPSVPAEILAWDGDRARESQDGVSIPPWHAQSPQVAGVWPFVENISNIAQGERLACTDPWGYVRLARHHARADDGLFAKPGGWVRFCAHRAAS